MARRFGFFPIMIASFATTVAFTLSFHDRAQTAAHYEAARPVTAR